MKHLIRQLIGEAFYLRLHKWWRKDEITRRENQNPEFIQRKNFYSSFIRNGELCFDVGANIGNRVGPLLSLGARVVAVEPQEYCYKILRGKYGNQIELVTKGLGERDDVKDFYISNAHTISSFSEEFVDNVKNGRFKEYTWNEPIQVKITTLDSLIKKYGHPHFIKIDVEGYELEVLKGLTSPVPMISFEYMVPEQTAKITACIEQIERTGSHIECNYSITETMEFALDSWLPADQMKEYVYNKKFIDTEFGDVYCRIKS